MTLAGALERYKAARRQVLLDKRMRKLRGDAWHKMTSADDRYYYYNEDTGEMTWEVPHEVEVRKQLDKCKRYGWGALPHNVPACSDEAT